MRSPITSRSQSIALLWLAFTSLLPIVLAMNLLVLLSGFTTLLTSWGGQGLPFLTTASLNGEEINRLYSFLLPLFFSLSLSYLLARSKGLDPIGTQLISMICFFRVTGFLTVDQNFELISLRGSILTSLICTWLSVRLFHYLSELRQLHIGSPPTAISPQLRKTFKLAAAGILTIACFELSGQILRSLPAQSSQHSNIEWVFTYFNQLSALPELILYKTIALLSWFIGLHGEHSAEGILQILNNSPVGSPNRIQLDNLHNVFMNIGGSGATFVVPILILTHQRLRTFRPVAKFALLFSCFNVNEILMFGLPIILNPVFLIPFLLSPFLNMLIVLGALKIELFIIEPEMVHWMSVPLYSAYQVSDSSLWAVATQLTCIVVDGIVYLPFLILASHQAEAPEKLQQLLQGEQYGFLTHALQQRENQQFSLKRRNALTQLSLTQTVLDKLRQGRLNLYYQPKFTAHSLEVVGFEALLRLEDKQGNISSPSFLPILYQEGLSYIIDRKVVDLIFSHVLHWQRLGCSVPAIALNFDKQFLLDSQAVRTLVNRAKQHAIKFDIEITEHTCIGDIEPLAKVVKQLRKAGHRVAIDDFGSGYSALTLLLELNVNEIKLDSQFIQAASRHTHSQRTNTIQDQTALSGETLMKSTVQLCHKLGLTVVAEGIETREQLKQTQRCEVDILQGYYLGRPMSHHQVVDFLDDTWNQRAQYSTSGELII